MGKSPTGPFSARHWKASGDLAHSCFEKSYKNDELFPGFFRIIVSLPCLHIKDFMVTQSPE
jgi:hypothetical protein